LMALLSFWAAASIPPPPSRPPEQEPGDMQFYYTANAVVSTINATLSVFLLAAYVELYRKTQSGFTLALIIVSTALLLNALAFNPYILWVFSFPRVGSWSVCHVARLVYISNAGCTTVPRLQILTRTRVFNGSID
jgi:hypothetical protein